MKVLFIGDIVGSLGRNAIAKNIPIITAKEQIDFIVANAENVSHGRGLTEKHYKYLVEELKIDMLTMGNHVWGKKDIFEFIESGKVIRPLNYSKLAPGKGYKIIKKGNKKLAVVNLIGKVYIESFSCPFNAISDILEEVKEHTRNILVDFHAEATSEKIAMGYYLDGDVSAVLGTHTHVPTSDYRILKNQTAYITDVGMCGALNGVIGTDKENIINRFTTGLNVPNQMIEKDDTQFNAVIIDICDKTGQANSVKSINIIDKDVL